MNQDELSGLFEKMVQGQCSKEETDLIIQLLTDPSSRSLLYALVNKQLQQSPADDADGAISAAVQEKLDRRLQDILHANIPPAITRRRLPRTRSLLPYAAAAVLLLCSFGIYLLTSRNKPALPLPQSSRQHSVPIIAGTNKAILTLGDGRQINLSDTSNGEIATQSSSVIKKTANGVLVYHADIHSGTQQQERASPVFNTITIPKGGQYQVVLPDGSKVWLNAASSLRYPAQFDQHERLVELTGEGYFEIAAMAAQPFIVVANHQRIEVLGTMFNVNAYVEESCVRTTLLKGAVRVSAAADDNQGHMIPSRTLRPGQQSELFSNDLRVSEGNTEAALAWKNGMFQFEGEDVKVVMRKIARWYDVEIAYAGNMQGKFFSGTISKYESLNEMLKMLHLTDMVSFTIEDRKITVH
jgi:transmembrane sensor